MKATVYNTTGEEVSQIELKDSIFGLKIKPQLVQQAVVAQQANSRKAIADTKGKGEVAGGGRKPWRQKGTGRARHGSIRSPLWRGGGIIFGPKSERNFTLKINKKVKRQAILMCLSDKAEHGKIIIVDKLELPEAKTKNYFSVLQNLGLRTKKVKSKEKTEKTEKKARKPKGVLLVLPKKDQNLQRAARNVSGNYILKADNLNVLDLLKYQYLLMPVEAIEAIEKTFAK